MNFERPLVSIYLLTYNQEKYIEDAINGLLSQDYPNLELAIVDDASYDGTIDIIKRMLPDINRKYVDVKLNLHSENTGNISKNVNEAVRLLSGDFIFGVAGDDILLPDAISSLMDALSSNIECNIVHANAYIIGEDYRRGEWFDKSIMAFYGRNSAKAYHPQKWILGGCYSIHATTVLLRKAVYERYGYRNENLLIEDFEYWLRISEKENFYYLDKPVILYRRTSNSLSYYESGDVEGKLSRAYVDDKKVLDKYINVLDEEQARNRWINFYSFYYNHFKKISSEEWLNNISLDMKKENIELDVPKRNIDNYNDKLLMKMRFFALWLKKKSEGGFLKQYVDINKYNKIAIYGYGDIGKALFFECFNQGIEINYVIDQKGMMLECPTDVYTLNDSFPDVDVVIVTILGIFQDLSQHLYRKGIKHVVDISEIVV